MAEKVLKTIYAGSSPVYEVVEVDGRIRIRVVDNPDEYIDLISTVLPKLIQVLQEIDKEINRK